MFCTLNSTFFFLPLKAKLKSIFKKHTETFQKASKFNWIKSWNSIFFPHKNIKYFYSLMQHFLFLDVNFFSYWHWKKNLQKLLLMRLWKFSGKNHIISIFEDYCHLSFFESSFFVISKVLDEAELNKKKI